MPINFEIPDDLSGMTDEELAIAGLSDAALDAELRAARFTWLKTLSIDELMRVNTTTGELDPIDPPAPPSPPPEPPPPAPPSGNGGGGGGTTGMLDGSDGDSDGDEDDGEEGETGQSGN